MSKKQIQSGCIALVCFVLMGLLILASVIADLVKPKPDRVAEPTAEVTDTAKSDSTTN